MKSFENINILIKVKLLIKVLEKVFEKRLSCERKKIFWEEKRFFAEKNVLKKNFFLEKKLFEKTSFGKKLFFENFLKKNFFYLWRLKVSANKSPGA